MKALLISLLILASLSFKTIGQDKNFRVEKIVFIRTNWDNKVDTIIQQYNYENSKLTKIVFIEKGKESDVYKITYNNDKMEVYNKSKFLQRSVQIDKDGKLTEFWSDDCDKFTLTYTGKLIQNIERYDKCDKYGEMNIFEYANNKLVKVKVYNKKGNPKYTTDYIFTYENDQLKKLVYGNNNDLFLITHEGNKIKKIEHSSGKPDWKQEFVYDGNGNIVEETIYTIKDGKETVSEKYNITYSHEKGNDDIIWSSYNWKYNIFLNQRTYKKHTQSRY